MLCPGATPLSFLTAWWQNPEREVGVAGCFLSTILRELKGFGLVLPPLPSASPASAALPGTGAEEALRPPVTAKLC